MKEQLSNHFQLSWKMEKKNGKLRISLGIELLEANNNSLSSGKVLTVVVILGSVNQI